MQSKTMNISVIESIEGKKNVCADMLSHLSHRPSDSNNDVLHSNPDITHKTFEVSMINSSYINPKTFAQYDHQIRQPMHYRRFEPAWL